MRTRLNRSQEGRRLHVTDRDVQLFQLLYESAVASAPQLAALLDDYPLTQGLERRLFALYQAGFLTRPAANFHLFGPDVRYGAPHLVYALGRQPASPLRHARPALDEHRLEWLLSTPPTQITHALAVSEFRAVLHRATRLDPSVSFDNWIQGQSTAVHFHTNHKGKLVDKSHAVRDHGVKPDAFGAVGLLAKGSRHRTQHFLLEADQSTMDHKRMLAKYRDYWLLWRHNQHRDQLGLESFVVLTVTVSPQRRDNLAELARKADDDGRGSLMFRFATEKDFDLEQPERILSPVWRTPVEKRPFAPMVR